MKPGFFLFFACGLLISFLGSSQPRPVTDSVAGPANPLLRGARAAAPKAYKEVITSKAKTDSGLFKVHLVDDKFFFEIPDSLLGRDMLVVNRISKAAAGARSGFTGYAGDQIGDNVIQFTKGPNNRVFMKNISFQEVSKDSAGLFQSVLNSNLQPIVAAFDVKAYGPKSSVIELTDYVNSDNDILFFEAQAKRSLGLGSQQPDKSYIETIHSYPSNIEIKTVKTYTKTTVAGLGGPGAPSPTPFASAGSGAPATYELNSSIVLLPLKPMEPRYFDPRVGYFATGYVDFDANPQGVKRISMVTRWRLEPKPEDVEKYKRGELVEPVKPIVYYIDPATPKKWVPYLIQGVNDWQVAFEKAGFKNAIYAKQAPLKDSTWSVEDASHSAIVYKPSDVANASGPHVHDPRSGEIIETHINWYHNVMSLVHDWYLIQTAAVDPGARKMQFNDTLMGQLIRFVSSHEVGHTLGLRHNYGSSSTVPVENLRNKAWVEAHGHTPSIMDYARFNYVAQPEDNITEKGLFPRIGDYDIWAIEWGYRWFPQATSAKEEIPVLNKWASEKLKDKRLWFGTEVDPDDPRGQNEDLGDDAMKASAYGIKNLQRILPNLVEWTKEPNESYDNLNRMYGQLTSQFNRYMGHVAKNIGGVMTTPKTVEQPGMQIENVSRSKQKEAMGFLQEQLFTTPTWLRDQRINSYIGGNPATTIGNIQDQTLGRLINNSVFMKLLRFEAENPKEAYTATEMMSDLRKGIWSELSARRPVDIFRRNLQKMYVERLISVLSSATAVSIGQITSASFSLNQPVSKTNDAISIVKAQLKMLKSDILVTLPAYTDQSTRIHLQDVVDRINDALEPGK